MQSIYREFNTVILFACHKFKLVYRIRQQSKLESTQMLLNAFTGHHKYKVQRMCSVSLVQDDPGTDKENSILPPTGVVPSAKVSEENVIDNPYLRPVKKPKVRRKK